MRSNWQGGKGSLGVFMVVGWTDWQVARSSFRTLSGSTGISVGPRFHHCKAHRLTFSSVFPSAAVRCRSHPPPSTRIPPIRATSRCVARQRAIALHYSKATVVARRRFAFAVNEPPAQPAGVTTGWVGDEQAVMRPWHEKCPLRPKGDRGHLSTRIANGVRTNPGCRSRWQSRSADWGTALPHTRHTRRCGAIECEIPGVHSSGSRRQPDSA